MKTDFYKMSTELAKKYNFNVNDNYESYELPKFDTTSSFINQTIKSSKEVDLKKFKEILNIEKNSKNTTVIDVEENDIIIDVKTYEKFVKTENNSMYRLRFLEMIKPTLTSSDEIWGVIRTNAEGNYVIRKNYLKSFVNQNEKKIDVMVVTERDEKDIVTVINVRNINSKREGWLLYKK
jgi:hypothetical protein